MHAIAHTPRTTARKAAAFVGVTSAAVLAASLTGCTFSASTIDYSGKDLARSVTKSLTSSNPGVSIADVTCDKASNIAAGKKTNCTATVNGQPTKLVVTWKNTDGDYSVSTV